MQLNKSRLRALEELRNAKHTIAELGGYLGMHWHHELLGLAYILMACWLMAGWLPQEGWAPGQPGIAPTVCCGASGGTSCLHDASSHQAPSLLVSAGCLEACRLAACVCPPTLPLCLPA